MLAELITLAEKSMLERRLKIMQLLREKMSIRKIALQVGVGTDTVMRMARKLEGSKILRDYFSPPSQSPSKWVFGQVGKEEEV